MIIDLAEVALVPGVQAMWTPDIQEEKDEAIRETKTKAMGTKT